jgi:ABC-type nickel/cobalt efflux system permease component RcnA
MGRHRIARRGPRLVGPIVGLIGVLLAPAVALAHPLGNFTINHYAGVRVEMEAIRLDVVIDMAEIPTFQERIRLDANADGEVSDDEAAAARAAECGRLSSSLDLHVGGTPVSLRPTAAGLTFPIGSGGLPTLRLVCAFEAPLAAPLGAPTRIEFADGSHAERIGWREIVVTGDRVTIEAADDGPASDAPASDAPAATSVSKRLTAYPDDFLTAPLDERSVSFVAFPGGPATPVFAVPDAQALEGAAGPGTEPAPAGVASVPGGVAGDVPEIFRADLTPVVALLSLLVAAALGAGHAVTPGHGKTLMAAYLVGTRGRAQHAVGLGLSVSVSHTLGILVLATLVVGAEQVVAPDVVVRVAPLIAAVTTVAIGCWMLATELRRRRATRTKAVEHVRAHANETAHDHGYGHGHRTEHGDHDNGLEHSHGGVQHRHAPPAGSSVTWRSLFALGLAGGIIPSTNALLILLFAIAAGRPLFGFVLVGAFGLGMAAVMTGVGLALVHARGLVGRLPGRPVGSRLAGLAPLAASVVVVVLGVWLTSQAVLGGAVL